MLRAQEKLRNYVAWVYGFTWLAVRHARTLFSTLVDSWMDRYMALGYAGEIYLADLFIIALG